MAFDEYFADRVRRGFTQKHILAIEKRMKGFVFISAEGVDEDQDLEYWIALALEFNPKAKSSKKKTKKNNTQHYHLRM